MRGNETEMILIANKANNEFPFKSKYAQKKKTETRKKILYI